ncbi:MAG: hypothetical protein QXK94_00570 [Candidatus Jordarchaeales archaeon]
MSVEQIISVINELLSTNENITAAAVITNDGRIIYQTNNWDVSVDAPSLIASWREKAPAISVQGIKYSVLQTTEERLVATNVSGLGHIILATIQRRGFLMVYVTPQGDAGGSYVDVSRAAMKLAPILQAMGY